MPCSLGYKGDVPGNKQVLVRIIHAIMLYILNRTIFDTSVNKNNKQSLVSVLACTKKRIIHGRLSRGGLAISTTCNMFIGVWGRRGFAFWVGGE